MKEKNHNYENHCFPFSISHLFLLCLCLLSSMHLFLLIYWLFPAGAEHSQMLSIMKKKKNESKNLPLWSSNPISIKQSIFLSSFHFSILNSHFATYSFYIDHIIICMHMKGNNCQKQKIFFSIELIKYHRYICCVFYTFFIYPL